MTPRLVLPLLASVALVAGCGGSSSSSTSSSSDTAPAAGRASSAASPARSAATAATGGAAVAPGSPASSAATSGVAAPGAAAAPAPAPAAGKPGTPAASKTSTAPGRYTYDTSGTVTAGTPRDASGTATLTVDPLAEGTQHSTLSGGQGKTEQNVLVRPGGTYLARLVITNPAFTKEFTFSPPVLLVPEPATNGRSYAWTAKSTDGKTTVAVTARIDRRDPVTIGGASVPTVVVKSTLKLTGDITYNGTMETWRDQAHRLTVKEHATGQGTVSGFAFSSDITSVVRSTRPS